MIIWRRVSCIITFLLHTILSLLYFKLFHYKQDESLRLYPAHRKAISETNTGKGVPKYRYLH